MLPKSTTGWTSRGPQGDFQGAEWEDRTRERIATRSARGRSLLTGAVTEELINAFHTAGVGDEEIEDVVRAHGKVTRTIFWDTWKLRVKVWEQTKP